MEGIRAHFGQVQDDVDVEHISDYSLEEHNLDFEANSEEETNFAGRFPLFSDQSPFSTDAEDDYHDEYSFHDDLSGSEGESKGGSEGGSDRVGFSLQNLLVAWL